AYLETATLINTPGGLEARALAGFEYETPDPPLVRQFLYALKNAGADTLASHLRQGVHPLDLAKPVAMLLERAHADGPAVAVARDEQGESSLGHFLDRHLELEFARRKRHQIGVELGHERAHIVLQRRFRGNGDRHRFYSTTFGTRKKFSSVAGALATMS